MKRAGVFGSVVILLLVLLLGTSFGAIHQKCINCHQNYRDMQGVVAGDLVSKSQKAGTITVDVGKGVEVIKIAEDLKLKNISDLKEAQEGLAVLVKVEKKGDEIYGKELIAKPKFDVPEDQLIKLEELKALVEKGPEKGNYVLIDSRPTDHYEAGHIPTSINIPFPKMQEMMGNLPKEKEKLLIFYCLGVR